MILDGKEYLFEGVIKGEIIEEKRGDSGFGYDPIFKPEGYEQTFAELGNENKEQDQSPCTGCTETLRVSATLISLAYFRTTACLDINEVPAVKFSQAIS